MLAADIIKSSCTLNIGSMTTANNWWLVVVDDHSVHDNRHILVAVLNRLPRNRPIGRAAGPFHDLQSALSHLYSHGLENFTGLPMLGVMVEHSKLSDVLTLQGTTNDTI